MNRLHLITSSHGYSRCATQLWRNAFGQQQLPLTGMYEECIWHCILYPDSYQLLAKGRHDIQLTISSIHWFLCCAHHKYRSVSRYPRHVPLPRHRSICLTFVNTISFPDIDDTYRCHVTILSARSDPTCTAEQIE